MLATSTSLGLCFTAVSQVCHDSWGNHSSSLLFFDHSKLEYPLLDDRSVTFETSSFMTKTLSVAKLHCSENSRGINLPPLFFLCKEQRLGSNPCLDPWSCHLALPRSIQKTYLVTLYHYSCKRTSRSNSLTGQPHIEQAYTCILFSDLFLTE